MPQAFPFADCFQSGMHRWCEASLFVVLVGRSKAVRDVEPGKAALRGLTSPEGVAGARRSSRPGLELVRWPVELLTTSRVLEEPLFEPPSATFDSDLRVCLFLRHGTGWISRFVACITNAFLLGKEKEPVRSHCRWYSILSI